MSLMCTLSGHRPAIRQVYNAGYYFSACARCGTDLVRASAEDWHAPPRGHRIVWKRGRHSHSIEADYSAFLPVAVPSASLPAVPSAFAARRRELVRLRRPAAARTATLAVEENADFRCPRVLLWAVMLGAGIKVLLTLGTAR